MMAGKASFNIDDAFEEEPEDSIRVYGSTGDRSPLKFKSRFINDDSIVVRVEDPINLVKNSINKFKNTDDSLSKYSDSLIQTDGSSPGSFLSPSSWWQHPKVRDNWKVVIAAFLLLIIGAGLILTGIISLIVPIGAQSFVFFIAGAICFIPGAYHVVYIYFAVKGKRGYDFYNLPLFN